MNDMDNISKCARRPVVYTKRLGQVQDERQRGLRLFSAIAPEDLW
jgi:hypothetical protein